MPAQVIAFPEAPKLRTFDKHSKYIDLLSKIASNQPYAGNARIAAAVVYKNTVIAVGSNKIKTHPFQAKFGKNGNSIHLHAEIDAIKNALRILSEKELSRATLYICRVKYFDEKKKKQIFGLSKPCDGCKRAIATFNIKKVVYSLDNEGYEVL